MMELVYFLLACLHSLNIFLLEFRQRLLNRDNFYIHQKDRDVTRVFGVRMYAVRIFFSEKWAFLCSILVVFLQTRTKYITKLKKKKVEILPMASRLDGALNASWRQSSENTNRWGIFCFPLQATHLSSYICLCLLQKSREDTPLFCHAWNAMHERNHKKSINF